MNRIWCLLWGHKLVAIESRSRDGEVVVWCCRRGGLHLIGVFPAGERLPARYVRRANWWVTRGPLRRVAEYFSCQVLGHDEEWEPVFYLDAERLRCQTCGRCEDVRPLLTASSPAA